MRAYRNCDTACWPGRVHLLLWSRSKCREPSKAERVLGRGIDPVNALRKTQDNICMVRVIKSWRRFDPPAKLFSVFDSHDCPAVEFPIRSTTSRNAITDLGHRFIRRQVESIN